MPDISMCKNNNCPSNKECFRFTAKPSGWQSYSSFTPKLGDKKCDYFVSNKEYRQGDLE